MKYLQQMIQIYLINVNTKTFHHIYLIKYFLLKCAAINSLKCFSLPFCLICPNPSFTFDLFQLFIDNGANINIGTECTPSVSNFSFQY